MKRPLTLIEQMKKDYRRKNREDGIVFLLVVAALLTYALLQPKHASHDDYADDMGFSWATGR